MILSQRLDNRLSTMTEDKEAAMVKRRCSDILDEWWAGMDDLYHEKYPFVKHEMWERLSSVYSCDEWGEAVDEWNSMWGLSLDKGMFR